MPFVDAHWEFVDGHWEDPIFEGGKWVTSARVPANTIQVGDRVWTHNAFRVVREHRYDESMDAYWIGFEPLYEGDAAFATNQEAGKFVLREPRKDELGDISVRGRFGPWEPATVERRRGTAVTLGILAAAQAALSRRHRGGRVARFWRSRRA